MTDFSYSPSPCIPFHDKEVIDRVRNIRRQDIAKHPNPDFRISVLKDCDVGFMWTADMFYRIKRAADEGRNCVLITPQPHPGYSQLAYLINMFQVDCSRLYTFNMDEYANEDGVIAPESWPSSFMHAMKKHFYGQLDPELRPPEDQIVGPTNDNIGVYGQTIEDLGGADCCYSGPGWTGHLAFIEPDAPEFAGTLDEWQQMGARVCTLSPFTLAQNSLHGSFGMSGDMAAVPPKAATIGPKEVIAAKHRIDMNALTIDGTFVAWQRIVTRLCVHGPVTPLLPTSIHQTLRTDCWISETIAADIEPLWDKGY